MREIKFRAWDKKKKCWFKTKLTFYGFTLFGECTLLCPPRVSYLKNLEIMQFTGLKDKNGKEIYEGDIVELNNQDIGEVIYQAECMRFVVNGKTNFFSFVLTANIGRTEIIGNIYENPELLEDGLTYHRRCFEILVESE